MNDYEKLLYKSNKQKRQLGILIKKITYYKQELQRKDNVIEELKKWLKELKILKTNDFGDVVFYDMVKIDVVLDKLKELKENK